MRRAFRDVCWNENRADRSMGFGPGRFCAACTPAREPGFLRRARHVRPVIPADATALRPGMERRLLTLVMEPPLTGPRVRRKPGPDPNRRLPRPALVPNPRTAVAPGRAPEMGFPYGARRHVPSPLPSRFPGEERRLP